MSPSVLDLMSQHSSVRDYADEPLDKDVLKLAFRAAQQASTSSDAQAYSVINVTEPATREQLVMLTGGQKMVGAAGAFLVICGDLRRNRLIAERASHPHHQNLESFMVAAVDASLFAQNLAIAFESMGLGMCFIGGLRNQLNDVDRLLNLPEGVLPLFGMCVGVPASKPAPKPRLPTEAVLLENQYPADKTMLALIDEHDDVMREYYAGRGLEGRDWSGGIRRKYEEPRRRYLAGYYASKGAQLT